MLDDIIPSKTRRKVLALFFGNSTEAFHLRRVSREVSEEVNAVKRELDILEKAKVLLKEKRLNKSIYVLNTRYILHDEFMRIFCKDSPLARHIQAHKAALGKVKFIAMSLKLMKKVAISDSEVYVIFVGTIASKEVQKIIHDVEKDYPFEINYTVMTAEELTFRKRQNDPFIWAFLKEPKVMIAGSEADLMA